MAKYTFINDESAPPGSFQEESIPETVGRFGVRTGARALETLVGLPGSLQQVGQQFSPATMAKEAIQSSLDQYPNLPQKEPLSQLLQGMPEDPPVSLPTIEDVRGFVKGQAEQVVPEGYLDPQSEYEKFGDQVTNDIVAMLHPLFGPVSATKAAISAASSLVGNTVKFGAEQLGLKKPWQEGLKFGSMMLTQLGLGPKLLDIADNLYKKSEELMPKEAPLPARNILKTIEKIKGKISKGDPTSPAKSFTRERLRRLKPLINRSSKTIKTEDATEFIRDINSFYKAKKVPGDAGHFMETIKDSLRESVQDLAPDAPEFVEAFNDSYNLYKNAHVTSTLGDAVRDSKFIKNYPYAALFFQSPKTALVGLAGKVGASLSDIGKRLLNNKTVAKTYGRLMAQAAKGPAAVTAKSFKQFDNIVRKAIGAPSSSTKNSNAKKDTKASKYIFID